VLRFRARDRVLSNNYLTGSIPSTLGYLSRLEILYVLWAVRGIVLTSAVV